MFAVLFGLTSSFRAFEVIGERIAGEMPQFDF